MAFFGQVGVVFGGPSPEHDVSILTGLQVVRVLNQLAPGERCHALYWTKTGQFYDVDPTIEALGYAEGPPKGADELQLVCSGEGGFFTTGRRARRLELTAVVNCCHGGPGEDGSLQAALDLAGVAYSGPSALGAALGMDKLASGALMAQAGLPVLPRVLVDSSCEPTFAGPYIVKPRTGGSSIGIDVVADFSTALARLRANVHLRRGAVLEPYRPELYDLQLAVRSYPQLQLSQIERPIRTKTDAPILDYAGKYVGASGMASAPRELPAQIDDELAGEIRSMATTVAATFALRGVARIDFLSDGSSLYANEINTIPGSLSWHLFAASSVSFEQLLDDLLAEARERPSVAMSAAGADGSLLRRAASISTKLG